MNKEILDAEEQKALEIKEQEEVLTKVSPLLIIGILLFLFSLLPAEESTNNGFLCCLSLIVIAIDRFLSKKFDYGIKIKKEKKKGISRWIRPTPFFVVGILFVVLFYLFPHEGVGGDYGYDFGGFFIACLFIFNILLLILDRVLIWTMDYKRLFLIELGFLVLTSPVLVPILLSFSER